VGHDSENHRQPYEPDWRNGLAHARAAKRCCAKTRRGTFCQAPAMANGRCRLHGGLSPGAPTGERNGNYRHGRYSKATRTIRRAAQREWEALRALISELSEWGEQ
jgi:hypothetical protein